MNRKENLLRTLDGEDTGFVPATPHWWGLYKFEHAGLLSDYDQESMAWGMGGAELAEVDARFYESFRPDMFHLTTGPVRATDSDPVALEKRRILQAVHDLESLSVIDEYVDAFYPDRETVLRSGAFDHIRILSHKYGSETLMMLNEGNPVSWVLDPHGCIGFENGLVAMMEKPDRMEYLLRKCYAATLPRMAALKEMGGDGYIGSETYCAADLISPRKYREVIFGAQRDFYKAVGAMGLIPVTYFLGDVFPLLEDLKELGVKALMVEEGKKGIRLDIGEIYRGLEGEVCLFGNLDSVYILQMGTRDDVVRETRRQLETCNRGGFVMANGCPISFSTPAANIRAMLDTARTK
jgi:hypothetical protein